MSLASSLMKGRASSMSLPFRLTGVLSISWVGMLWVSLLESNTLMLLWFVAMPSLPRPKVHVLIGFEGKWVSRCSLARDSLQRFGELPVT